LLIFATEDLEVWLKKVKKIKILHVFDNLNIGGAETLIMNIFREIHTSFIFDFIVHTNIKGIYEDEIIKLGGNIYRFDKFKLFNYKSYKSQWRDFLKANKGIYSIVHGHLRITASIYSKICSEFNQKIIIHSHSTSAGISIKGIIKKMLFLPLKSTKAGKIACSKQACNWLFGKNNDCFILNNGVDFSRFAYSAEYNKSYRDEFSLNQTDIVLGHIGRFDNPKNQIFLLKILRELPSQYKLVLVGDGKTRKKCTKFSIKEKIYSRVVFTGVRKDVNKLMSCFDVFVFPSKYEGLPVTLIEAQAARIRCIISKNITDEAIITKNSVIKIGITSREIKNWVNKIVEMDIDRLNDDYLDSSFDIFNVSKSLESYYRSILNE